MRCVTTSDISQVISQAAGTLIRLVDQAHRPRAVVHADRRRRALLPVIERIAQRGEIGRRDVGARKDLVARGGGELQDPVLHGQNGVAAGDLPLAVGAVTGKAVADLDGAENAALPNGA